MPLPLAPPRSLQSRLGHLGIQLSVEIRRQEIARPFLAQLSHHVTLGDLNMVARDTRDFGDFLGFLVKDGREG